jgi:hypothetical protein
MHKHLLVPTRVRRIPRQFSWVDQRLVRDGHLAHCDAQALALYLFLVTVADAQGLSYYGDASLGRWLSLRQAAVARARAGLLKAELIAYAAPLYQVLSLEPREGSLPLATPPPDSFPPSEAPRRSPRGAHELRTMRELLRQVLERTP